MSICRCLNTTSPKVGVRNVSFSKQTSSQSKMLVFFSRNHPFFTILIVGANKKEKTSRNHHK